MKINDSNLNSISTATQQTTQAAAEAAKTNTTNRADGRSDRVQLSDLSSSLSALAAGGPEREARVEELAAAYRSGNYKVNAASVGQSLIGDAFQNR